MTAFRSELFFCLVPLKFCSLCCQCMCFFFDCIKDYCTCSKNIHANGLMTLKYWGLIFFILYPDKSPRKIQQLHAHTATMAGLPFWTVKTLFFWDKTECDVIRRARICHFTFAASMVVK